MTNPNSDQGHAIDGCDGDWIDVSTLTHPNRAMCADCRAIKTIAIDDLNDDDDDDDGDDLDNALGLAIDGPTPNFLLALAVIALIISIGALTIAFIS